jgi:hypothetical protein
MKPSPEIVYSDNSAAVVERSDAKTYKNRRGSTQHRRSSALGNTCLQQSPSNVSEQCDLANTAKRTSAINRRRSSMDYNRTNKDECVEIQSLDLKASSVHLHSAIHRRRLNSFPNTDAIKSNTELGTIGVFQFIDIDQNQEDVDADRKKTDSKRRISHRRSSTGQSSTDVNGNFHEMLGHVPIPDRQLQRYKSADMHFPLTDKLSEIRRDRCNRTKSCKKQNDTVFDDLIDIDDIDEVDQPSLNRLKSDPIHALERSMARKASGRTAQSSKRFSHVNHISEQESDLDGDKLNGANGKETSWRKTVQRSKSFDNCILPVEDNTRLGRSGAVGRPISTKDSNNDLLQEDNTAGERRYKKSVQDTMAISRHSQREPGQKPRSSSCRRNRIEYCKQPSIDGLNYNAMSRAEEGDNDEKPTSKSLERANILSINNIPGKTGNSNGTSLDFISQNRTTEIATATTTVRYKYDDESVFEVALQRTSSKKGEGEITHSMKKSLLRKSSMNKMDEFAKEATRKEKTGNEKEVGIKNNKDKDVENDEIIGLRSKDKSDGRTKRPETPRRNRHIRSSTQMN